MVQWSFCIKMLLIFYMLVQCRRQNCQVHITFTHTIIPTHVYMQIVLYFWIFFQMRNILLLIWSLRHTYIQMRSSFYTHASGPERLKQCEQTTTIDDDTQISETKTKENWINKTCHSLRNNENSINEHHESGIYHLIQRNFSFESHFVFFMCGYFSLATLKSCGFFKP